MISYTITFEERADGSMKIELTSPPAAHTTTKEQLIAREYADHIKAVMEEIRRAVGGRVEFGK